MLGTIFRDLRRGFGLASAEAMRGQVATPRGALQRRDASPAGFSDTLRRALDDDEFELHYQPIVDLVSRQWLGAEALCRWRRSDGRVIPPKEFIPEAERSGLITDLGAWVIAQATRDQLDLRSQGLSEEFYFAVNIAVPQLAEWETLERSLDDASAQGANLKLEVTESMFDPDAEKLAHRLESLRGAGAAIAIDDFTTGFSSLARLHALPVTTLKIDQSFILQAREPAGYELLAGIAAMARGLGFDMIAEGVEQEAQVNLLLSLRLTIGQGFLFARPRPFDDFCAALRMVGGLPLTPRGGLRMQA